MTGVEEDKMLTVRGTNRVVYGPHTKPLSETPLFRLLIGCVIHSLRKLYATDRKERKPSSLKPMLSYEFPKVTERALAFRERFGLRLSCLADTQEPIHESEDEQCNTGEPE